VKIKAASSEVAFSLCEAHFALTGVTPRSSLVAGFSYQTTDPNTNELTGTPNTPVDIAAGSPQSYLFAITPTAEMSPREVQLSLDCTNSNPALLTSGLNTLLLSASSTPVPDIVALAATPTSDGTEFSSHSIRPTTVSLCVSRMRVV
jgi:hypothetical protein